MLKAASLLRPFLSRSCLACQNLAVHRIPTSSPNLQPNNPLWNHRGSSRCIMQSPGGEVSESVEIAMKARDGIPSDFRLIYRAPHEYYFKVAYTTAVLAIIPVPAVTVMIYLSKDSSAYPMMLAGLPLFESAADAFLMLGLLALTIFNIAHTVSKYPLRIYRNPLENTYIAVFQNAIPGLIKRYEFAAGDVQKGGAWIWKEATYTIKKKKKVLLIHEHFSTPVELDRMTIKPHKDSSVEKQKRRSRML